MEFVVFGLVCAVIWGLYVDYSISAVGHVHTVWQTYLFRGICQWYEMYTSVVDHTIGGSDFMVLVSMYDISGVALECFKNYLRNKVMQVLVGIVPHGLGCKPIILCAPGIVCGPSAI